MASSGAAATCYSQQKEKFANVPDLNVGENVSDKSAADGSASQISETQSEQRLQGVCVDIQSDKSDVNTQVVVVPSSTHTTTTTSTTAVNKNLMMFRRFKDSDGVLRNFNSLPLFVYATSPSNRATSADGVSILKELTSTNKNMAYDLHQNSRNLVLRGPAIDVPMNGIDNQIGMRGSSVGPSTTTVVIGGADGVAYQHHLNIGHHLHPLANHQSPYSNNYPLHHSSSHHHIHSDQTKSLQELQHEVGALLEFRDLVIETFPDLKLKMTSMTSSASSAAVSRSVSGSVSGVQAVAGGSSLVSRREWEPGIRNKRKLSHKEYSTVSSTTMAVVSGGSGGAVAVGELSSMSRSRSNSHSGKKEPKSGENNNGSVIQDSGFSTETSSSKEGHSASSTNVPLPNPIALNRLPCLDADDELLNLLDVIHRKSNRLREEVEHLQNYERQNLRKEAIHSEHCLPLASEAVRTSTKSDSNDSRTNALTPSTFREHVERLNKEDLMQLRKERDKLLDKLAEMEAETLAGRIKTAKMSDQVEELTSVKRDLEEQLKIAMAQKLELSSRIQQLQQQQQSSSSQLDFSTQRNFSTPTVAGLSSGSELSKVDSTTTTVAPQNRAFRPNTFQPVIVIDKQHEKDEYSRAEAFHQSGDSDSKPQKLSHLLGRLDGIVSTPGGRNTKSRHTDSERITAILLETSVIELQRHLLTLSVQNQILMQKLDQTTKSKLHLTKRLDKSKDDVEDLRFQLEEKSIELEGTKAQLRVLESRMNASTLSSGAANNSYMHSQNDYETNRSSASTTLMLSRRGLTETDVDFNDLSISRMPPTSASQISTPSMKAMIHLPMDEQQHHSSSTESAHDHDLQQDLVQTASASHVMSPSGSGMGTVQQYHQATSSDNRAHLSIRKVMGSAMSKPSKIPLPGSKSTSHFSGKPPTGRPLSSGRSPPSGNTSTVSHASNKSMLSRSTGNLLYSKSPNSLKRTDSSQSIRKENSSLSTNNSRSSTSSSIPMATTPYSGYKSSYGGLGVATPSPRLLQNSPLPKHKRESLTSRVRHLDSLSRAQQHNSHSHMSNDSECSSQSTTPVSGLVLSKSPNAVTTTSTRNFLATSTPKPSTIAAQLNGPLRKDHQMGTNNFGSGSGQITLRVTGNSTKGALAKTNSSKVISSNPTSAATTSNAPTTISRRFSSASVIGSRGTISTRNQHEMASGNVTGASDHQTGSGVASDSESGKKYIKNNFNSQTCPNQYPTTQSLRNWAQTNSISNRNKIRPSVIGNGNDIVHYEHSHPYNLLGRSSQQNIPNTSIPSTKNQRPIMAIQEEEEQFDSVYSLFGSSEHFSDNILVTFDYGFCDSLEEAEEIYKLKNRQLFVTNKEDDFEITNGKLEHNEFVPTRNGLSNESESISEDDLTNPFKVHRMQHSSKDNSLSLQSSYTEYNVDGSIPDYTCKQFTISPYNDFEYKFYNGIGFLNS